MLNRRTLSRGFTLVEMLLYVGICSTLLLALSLFFSSLLGVKAKSRTISEVSQQGAQISNFISYTIRNAQGISVPSGNMSSSTLVLSMRYPSQATSTLYATNGTLFLREGTSTPIALSNRRVTISSLVFTNTSASSTDGGSVTSQFTLTHSNPANRNEFSFSKMFTVIADFH